MIMTTSDPAAARSGWSQAPGPLALVALAVLGVATGYLVLGWAAASRMPTSEFLDDGGPRLLATGSSVNSRGEIRTYAELLRTGVLQLVVPRTPVTLGTADGVGTYPWDPSTPLLAKSGEFTITVTK